MLTMAVLVHRHWEPQLSSGLSRRDRRGCDYDAYVPDVLLGRAWTIDGGVAADVADAERAVTRLNAEAVALVDSEALARLLLRADAVASSRIEGLEVGNRRLLRAEAAQMLRTSPSDVTAEEILANINAMAWAVESVADAEQITVEHLLGMHRLLLAGTRLEGIGGRIRETQNWIGGSSFNPCGAAFVPPPPEELSVLLADLCAFCNQDALPALVQAAVAHAQFETIHPFADGNGRTGRIINILYLVSLGLLEKPVLYLSTEASAELAAALEGATFAPAMRDIKVGGDDGAFSAVERLFLTVNGPTGCDNPQRQGLVSALLGERGPLNVLGGIPTVATDYSPLWDVNIVQWTQKAIDLGWRSRVIDEFQILALADAGAITGLDGAKFGSAGFVVNCPIVVRFL